MKNSIIAFVSVLTLGYLFGSFTFASFDIKDWDLFARGLIAYVTIFFAFMAFVIVSEK